MSTYEVNALDEALLDILHVVFVKNSEELDQKFFSSNLTDFTPNGINIQLNFSDPLLISQGDEADSLRIKMLKSFFLIPDQLNGNIRSLQVESAVLTENQEYLMITANIPKQVPSEAELAQIQDSAQFGSDAMEN